MKNKILTRITLCFLIINRSIFSQTAYVVVLGNAQDGAYPHLGCKKECCQSAWKNDSLSRYATSLALVDPQTKQWWLFEATPDIKQQVQHFQKITNQTFNYWPNGIFISHAHIGHYTGLMQLGREVANTNAIPVYVPPRLKKYLEENGPWSQLVKLKNISLIQLDTNKSLVLTKEISIQTFTVPHRDEFSETAGFVMNTADKKYLFIPDIDKWQKWNKSIVAEVKKVDVAFLDGTFNDVDELTNRKIEEVPHPFVPETMALFETEEKTTKNKIHFIHLNHTNKVLWEKATRQKVIKKGFNVAEQDRSYQRYK